MYILHCHTKANKLNTAVNLLYSDQLTFNILRPRQNCPHFADDIFKCIFLNEFSFKISLKFVPKVQNENIPTLFQIMTWHCPGNKPLSEPMTGNLLTHIFITRRQWVKTTLRVFFVFFLGNFHCIGKWFVLNFRMEELFLQLWSQVSSRNQSQAYNTLGYLVVYNVSKD